MKTDDIDFDELGERIAEDMRTYRASELFMSKVQVAFWRDVFGRMGSTEPFNEMLSDYAINGKIVEREGDLFLVHEHETPEEARRKLKRDGFLGE